MAVAIISLMTLRVMVFSSAAALSAHMVRSSQV